jgi:acid phosphatase family membrane protein YuiD
MIALVALISAQLFKFGFSAIAARRVDFTRLTGMGGMPSAHSASVCALSTSIGLQAGWSSPVFGVAACF